ncbi:CsbD family protein [Nonomuraea sp. NPDC004297]
MGKKEKVKAKAQEIKGMIKERLGADTGDRSREAGGRATRVKANLKQAFEKAKDAFKK